MNSKLGVQVDSRSTALRRFRQHWRELPQHSVLSTSSQPRPAYPVRHGLWHPMVSATRASEIARLMPNYAFERTAKRRGWRAARVQRDFTLAAHWLGLARPAQRGRWASVKCER